MNILSSHHVSKLALSLLVAVLAPAACAVGGNDPSPREEVASARQADSPAPAHEWLFQETSGTTTSNAVATGAVTGTLGSSASLGGGLVTLTADASFDPESYVDFGDTVDAFGAGDFTVAHWYKTTFGGGGLGDLLGNRVDSSHGQFISARINGGGQVSLEVDEDGNGTNYVAAGTSVSVNDGAWHHLAFVRQGATVSIYVDGALSASGAADSGQPANVGDGSASFRLGRRLGDCCSNFVTVPASYADLRIYDSALGADDIATLVGGSSATSCPFGTYDCTGNPADGCTSTVPCDTGGHCTDGSGCASGACSDGACQEVVSWECNYHCDVIDSACHDVQADTLDDCIVACGSDSPCLDGCYGAYEDAYAQCDAQVPACQAVCNGSCADGTQDDGESGLDCGGPCTACSP